MISGSLKLEKVNWHRLVFVRISWHLSESANILLESIGIY